MSIILRNIGKFRTLKLLKLQGVRYNKSESYRKYLERMNIIKNDPIRIYKEMLNRSGADLSKYINDLDRGSYSDISQVNEDNDITWNVSNVTDMISMFHDAKEFNKSIFRIRVWIANYNYIRFPFLNNFIYLIPINLIFIIKNYFQRRCLFSN